MASEWPYNFGLLPGVVAYNAGGGGGLLNPLTTMPQTGSVIYDMNPDIEIGTATNGAEVLSVRDSGPNNITATGTAGSGPTFVTGVANGHAALRIAAPTKSLTLGRPAALATPMTNANAWSIMIVYRNPTNVDTLYSAMFGDVLNKVGGAGFSLGATVSGPKEDSNLAPNRSFTVGDPATNVHTLIYSGDGGFDTTSTVGRLFHDGTMFWGTYPIKIMPNSDALRIGGVVDSTGLTSVGRGFKGDILRIIIWSTPLSAPEAWQADAYARTYYGKPLATAGMSFFTVFDGDSQTMGTGAGSNAFSNANDVPFGDHSMPWEVAKAMGWQFGGFGNVGKPSARISATNNNSLILSAARDVDQWKAVMNGGPILLIWGEFYNEPGTVGVTLANASRTYATARKVADPTLTIRTWTSLSSFSRDLPYRDDFNNSLVSTPGDCGTIIPVHTDTSIGINGAAGPTATPTQYFPDGKHLNSVGTPIHASWITPYVHL